MMKKIRVKGFDKFEQLVSQSGQLLSRVQLFAIQWTATRQASLSITNSQGLLKLMSIMSVMPSNHLILCRPLLLPPSVFPRIRLFYNELVPHIRWPKYLSFSFSINSSFEYSGLISFRIDWLALLAIQGTLKSLPHRVMIVWLKDFLTFTSQNVKATVLWSLFFPPESVLESVFSPGQQHAGTPLSRDAGLQPATWSRSLTTFCIHTAIFTFSTVFNKLNKIFNT